MPARHDALRDRAALWFRYAQDDLRSAVVALTADARLGWVAAFHAQQAAEKALKSILVSADIDPPHTHDISRLRESLIEIREPAETLSWADELSEYAVTARYPRIDRVVEASQARSLIAVAERVMAWVSQRLGERGVHVDA